MKQPFLQDDTLFLRAVEPEDLGLLYSIENDPAMWDMGTVTIPYSRYALHHFIESTQNDLYADRQLRLMACLQGSGERVGIVDLFHFEPRHARAEAGITLLQAYRGRGLALRTIRLLTDYAGRVLHLHSLSAWVATDNERSRHLFQKAGFEERGVLKDWFMTSEGFKDIIIYQKLLAKNKGKQDEL